MAAQGTREWLLQRLAKITGIRIHDVIVDGKGAEKVFDEILNELETGELPEEIDNEYMAHGRETEPVAAEWYGLVRGELLEEVNFIPHPAPDLKNWCGASPDRLVVGRNKYIEIKCPATKAHSNFCKNRNIPVRYQSQMLLQMAVSPEIESVDFVSFDDREENYEGIEHYEVIAIKNFPRDRERIEAMEETIRKFIMRLKKAL